MRSRAHRLLLALAAFACGCAQQEETLIWLRSPAWTTAGCVVNAGAMEALNFGYLDVSPYRGELRSQYDLPGVIKNNAPVKAVSNTGIDDNEVQILDALVRLEVPQAAEAVDALDPALVEFRQTLPGNSLPSGSTIGVLVTVIPQATAEALRPIVEDNTASDALEVDAYVTVRAKRTGSAGKRVGIIEAREYHFPIYVCSGCLYSCDACPDSECPPGTLELNGGICNNSQDVVIQPQVCVDPPAETTG